MPRLTSDQWETIRAEREAGASFRELAEKYGVSHQAVQKRANNEGWSDGQDVGEAIRRKVAEKVAGVVAAANPKKKAEAIDAAADKVASVIDLHKQEWQAHRETFGIVPPDFETGKTAKISSEILTIRQKGERLAHGLDDAAAQPTIVIERSFGK